MDMEPREKIKVLKGLLNRIDDLRTLNYTAQEFKDWREEVKLHLREFYGEDDEYFKRFKGLSFQIFRFVLAGRKRGVDSLDLEAYNKGLDATGVILRALIKRESFYPVKEKPKKELPETPIGERGNVFQFYITQANQNYNINDITLDQYISQVVDQDVKQLLQQLNEEVRKPDTKWKTIGNILKKLADKGTNFLIQAIVCLIKSQLGI